MNAKPLTSAQWRRHPLPDIASTHSKEDRGSVLVVAGSERNPGAAWLAAIAALRAGAGRLTVATASGAIGNLAPGLPEAMVVPLRVGRVFEKCIERADSIVIGPGWEPSAVSKRWVQRLLAQTKCPVVIDAGAMHGWGDVERPSRCILTPHAGEMAKLSGHTRTYVEKNAVRVASDFARCAGVVLLLKGARSFLVDGDGPIWMYTGGHPGLGTSGSGDVLAGCIGGLAARGLDPFWAAAWGAHLHGSAGHHLAKTIGPTGYLAREVADAFPTLLRSFQR
jgi:ADP-dependent NAD(P)H-hydrate dehydratase